MRVSRFVAALSVTGALLGVSAPAYSAPLTPLSISAKPPQADSAVQVRFGGFHGGGFGGFRGGGFGGWRGGGWHRGFGWGGVGALAAGAVIGGALAAPYYYGGDSTTAMMMRTMDPATAIPATALSSSRRVTAIMAIHMDPALTAIMAAAGKPFRARARRIQGILMFQRT